MNSNPFYTLDVVGDINYTGTLRLNGTAIPYGVLLFLQALLYQAVVELIQI